MKCVDFHGLQWYITPELYTLAEWEDDWRYPVLDSLPFAEYRHQPPKYQVFKEACCRDDYDKICALSNQ